jgi:hypothetical protein
MMTLTTIWLLTTIIGVLAGATAFGFAVVGLVEVIDKVSSHDDIEENLKWLEKKEMFY